MYIVKRDCTPGYNSSLANEPPCVIKTCFCQSSVKIKILYRVGEDARVGNHVIILRQVRQILLEVFYQLAYGLMNSETHARHKISLFRHGNIVVIILYQRKKEEREKS